MIGRVSFRIYHGSSFKVKTSAQRPTPTTTTKTSYQPFNIMNRNGTVPSTPRVPRPPPFTPKRPLSTQSTPSTTNDLNLAVRLSRTNSNSSTSSSLSTPQTLLSTTHKKYKAPLSVESRSKSNYGKTVKPVLPTVPGTPTKKDGTQSRPRTPNTPRKGAESPSLMPAAGEMDVSNVDPEQVLVDYQTVEPGDVSGEIDEAWLRAAELDHGKQDKVMVSIRSALPFPSISSCKFKLIYVNVDFGRQIQRRPGSPLHPTNPSNWTLHMPKIPQPLHPAHRSISMPSSQERPTNLSTPLSPVLTYTPPWRAITPLSSHTVKQPQEKHILSAVTPLARSLVSFLER